MNCRASFGLGRIVEKGAEEQVFGLFKHHLRLKCFSSLSGQSFSKEAQALRQGVDVWMGTPDRLDALANQRFLDFDAAEVFVVDEFDTLLDAGYTPHILNYVRLAAHHSARMLFVGATVSRAVTQFTSKHFSSTLGGRQPYLHQLVQRNTHLNLTHLKHEFVQPPSYDKAPTLLKLLFELRDKPALVFCNTVASVRATEYLLVENGFRAVSLHGELPPKQRLQNIEEFRNRKVRILVSTDLGSRGLDFDFLEAVIQFDFPRTISDYVHRAGRAGRGGRPGSVFTLYRAKHMRLIKELEASYTQNKPLRVVRSAFSARSS